MHKQIDQISFDGETIVAMSGGVDSSVAAALLVEEGHKVHGIMMRLWSESGAECDNACCTPQAVQEAEAIADQLKIPFDVIDVSDLFREVVVQYFLDAYAGGKTPNPCIVCNRYLRWGYLLEWILNRGALALATGHYAVIEKDASGLYRLGMGLDEKKDQSYMLSKLNQKQLSHTCLPLGKLQKQEVRGLAHRFRLSVAEKEESQDLCFLGKSDLRSFLYRYIPQAFQPGLIKNLQGEILGEHQGLPFYTIGQRKGLGISHMNPLFVYQKDIAENTLIVAEKEELIFQNLVADEVNWSSGSVPETSFEALLKIRYKSSLLSAKITPDGDSSFMADLVKPVRDITPGQFAVLYQDRFVVASGEIRNSR